MNLSRLYVPRAAPFQQGDWNGREFVVVQRRWTAAVVCWIIAVLPIVGIITAIIWPSSMYVPERDQFEMLGLVSIAFAMIGLLIVLWKRVWLVTPAENSVSHGSGFTTSAGRRVAAAHGLWLQVHPISVAVRGAMGWAGHAVIIHADEGHGVVIGTTGQLDEAHGIARRVSDMTRIAVRNEPGVALTASV